MIDKKFFSSKYDTVNGGKKGTAGKKGTFISSTISKQIYSLEVLK